MERPIGPSRTETLVAAGLFGVLWVYLWLRAQFVPFSHDEVATYFHYVHSGRYIPFVDAHWYANNHLLNTLLTRLCYLVAGPWQLVLRVPNLLAFPVFAWYTWQMGKVLRPEVRWPMLAALWGAHYMVEFFALCRGYGLAMAGLVAAVHHLQAFHSARQMRHGAYALAWGALATLSNLTLINTFALLIGWVALHGQWGRMTFRTRAVHALPVVILGLLPLAFMAAYALALQDRGLLDVGTLDGFWRVTLLTNLKVFIGTDHAVAAWAVVALVASMAGLLGMRIWGGHRLLSDPATVPALLFFGNLGITLFLGRFMGVNYPEDRAAMYFYPLLVLGLGMLIEARLSGMRALTVAAPMLIMPIHFLFHVNLSHTIFWKDLNMPVHLYDRVVADWGQAPGRPVVGGYRMRGFTWVYLNHIRGGQLDPVHSDGYPDVEADYQIGLLTDGRHWGRDYVSMGSDPASGLHVLRRRERLRREAVLTTSPIGTDGETDREFFELLNLPTDSLGGTELLLNIDMTLTRNGAPFVAHLVAAVNDSTGERICYEFIGLDHLQAAWDGTPHNFRHGIMLHGVPLHRGQIKVYVWNMHRMDYRASDATVSIMRLGL